MVEVFKTNVNELQHAEMLISRIHKTFMRYRANFDLHDCDKILRVMCTEGSVEAERLISFLHDLGFTAEVLPDIVPTLNHLGFSRTAIDSKN
ncbi:MAG: hypothetical protein ABIN01_07745 [Ferruginibacter sp.]